MDRLRVAEATAIAVTVIVGFGKDPDLLYALPLGFLSAILTLLFAEIPNLRIRRLLFVHVRR